MTLKPCGTPAAFARHRRRGEKPCGECREAENSYQRVRSDSNTEVQPRRGVPTWPRVVELPRLDADTFVGAPCVVEGPELWEATRDEEPDRVARSRWRRAAELCLTECPAFRACERLAGAQVVPGGVWAGRVPRIRGERL